MGGIERKKYGGNCYIRMDVLKCELAVLCGRFETEDEFLAGVLEYLAKLAGAPEEYLDYWGLRDDAGVSVFSEKLDAVRRHVEATLRTPYAERGKQPFA